MGHPNIKPDNSTLFKSSFLRTVKYDNFVFPTLLSILVFLKMANLIWKKDRNKERKKGVAPKRETHIEV
jgi:hypothetical protein